MTIQFCQFKHALGKEGEGFHSTRFLGIAIFDLLGTIVIAFIINRVFKNTNFFLVLAVLIIIAIILHRIFCVNTTINKLIFGTV